MKYGKRIYWLESSDFASLIETDFTSLKSSLT